MITTSHICPCCRTTLRRWNLSIYQPPVHIFWCVACLRPVCLEPRAVLPRVAVPPRPAVQDRPGALAAGVPHA